MGIRTRTDWRGETDGGSGGCGYMDEDRIRCIDGETEKDATRRGEHEGNLGEGD